MGKEKFKFKNDLTSLDDKLRIANKVNDKYLGLEKEKVDLLQELCLELGSPSEEILANYPNHIKGTDKGKCSAICCSRMDDKFLLKLFLGLFIY